MLEGSNLLHYDPTHEVTVLPAKVADGSDG